MAQTLRITYPGAYCHTTSRDNEQRDAFRNNRDREEFLSCLEYETVRYGTVIHAYCLMNNHYHLLLQTPEGNLKQIMRHINDACTTCCANLLSTLPDASSKLSVPEQGRITPLEQSGLPIKSLI